MLIKYLLLGIYYGFAFYLPRSSTPFLGKYFKWIRGSICRGIFANCGKNINVESKAFFGSGINLSIGDFSGLGYKCKVPSNIQIGNYVLMGPEVIIFSTNHKFSDINIPICFQGYTMENPTIIQDDVWIGQRAIILPGKLISKGSIIGAGSVVTKNTQEYSIVVGNPAKVVKNRIE